MSIASENLRAIKTFADLIPYLEEELGWPLLEYEFEDLTYKYSAEEVGLKEEDAAKVKSIHQLRPLRHGQPWGIFFVEFERKRMPVVVLRRILSHLVIKKRASANRAQAAAWDLHDLLFISAFGDESSAQREMAFAHFHQDDGELPTLRVVGWDGGDTPLKLEYVKATLNRRLQWPEDPDDHEAWRAQWSGAFRHGQRHVINTADALAERLATLARGIRDAAETLIAYEAETGPLRQLHKAFQTALIHDLTETDFADTYAQTITYGLLTAAISRTEMSEGRYGTALVSGDVTEMVPVTNPFLREMMQTFLQAGGQQGGINFDELGIQDVVELLRGEETDLPAILRDFGNKTQGEDPVIHFYEHFLSAYNKQLKVQRGVFYTPKPAVSYIVRSVHELLQSEFGLADGLASTVTWGEMAQRLPDLTIPTGTDPGTPFVMILDIATGTATFLVEVIDVIHHTMTAKWKAQGLNESQRKMAWNDYVPRHLLPRLYGYELMMAPYAIAHMKIGLKLSETGYRFGSDERVRVYLTNALEPADDDQKAFQGILPALAHEAQAVNEVKRYVRFTVLVGNPPYSGISSNMTEYGQRIVDNYKIVDGQALKERKLWLQDDYVKFFRVAQTILECVQIGILGVITNHSYLDNPTFRGMRQSIMSTFPSIQILDLHGNANKKEMTPDGAGDQNVFDIRQGVAICLACRGNMSSKISHSNLWGSQEFKHRWLQKNSIKGTDFAFLSPDSPYYFLVPRNTDFRFEYMRGWPINEFMPVNSAGVITARDHFVVDVDRDTLLARIDDFSNSAMSDDEIRVKFFTGRGSDKYPDGDTRGWKLPRARKTVQADRMSAQRVSTCLYRPFDRRYIYWADWMIDWPRPEVMGHMIAGPNIGIHVCRQSVSDTWGHILVTRGLTDDCYVSNKTRERGYAHPLFLYPDKNALALQNDKEPNFSAPFLKALSFDLGLPQVRGYRLPEGLSPEGIFSYVYATCYSPTYRIRYAEFLKIDFPRVPLTSFLDLFHSLANLGKQLIALHLVEFTLTDEPDAPADWPRYPRLARFQGQNTTVEQFPSAARAWKDGYVAINNTSGFVGVPEEVWNFQIGGYQVCHKWLKDRKGRTLSDEDLLHYAKIVTALHETIRLMEEIDEVIEEHGGWPDAFVTE